MLSNITKRLTKVKDVHIFTGQFQFPKSGKLTVLLKAICSCEWGSDHLN